MSNQKQEETIEQMVCRVDKNVSEMQMIAQGIEGSLFGGCGLSTPPEYAPTIQGQLACVIDRSGMVVQQLLDIEGGIDDRKHGEGIEKPQPQTHEP